MQYSLWCHCTLSPMLNTTGRVEESEHRLGVGYTPRELLLVPSLVWPMPGREVDRAWSGPCGTGVGKEPFARRQDLSWPLTDGKRVFLGGGPAGAKVRVGRLRVSLRG